MDVKKVDELLRIKEKISAQAQEIEVMAYYLCEVENIVHAQVFANLSKKIAKEIGDLRIQLKFSV